MVKHIPLTLALWAFAAVTPVIAADKDDAGKKELEKLQGTWNFVIVVIDGNQLPKGEGPQTITFKGDTITVKQGDKVLQAGTHKLDPSTKPNSVDAKITEGEGKGGSMLGIYELNGDTLKVCFDMQGKKRPTEFKAPSGSGHFQATMKRSEKK